MNNTSDLKADEFQQLKSLMDIELVNQEQEPGTTLGQTSPL